MKKITCLLFFISVTLSLLAQQKKPGNDTKIQPLENVILAKSLNSNQYAISYFNIGDSDLFVIDKRIFSGSKLEESGINLSTLRFIKLIKDSLSKSNIKRIIFYESVKRKNSN
ncbi:hypothetical protein [Pedobacter sandarakinus]|uniref:hypothetical protein n=1 Tax=Pedobacter sandarakinus TaxID=353156 RepID=UPI0022479D1C|nr:hypothetical protein [Pedobacter sandarakinus]MCX2576236.1 hypothetical protein [Pedobacter sandarakinus]